MEQLKVNPKTGLLEDNRYVAEDAGSSGGTAQALPTGSYHRPSETSYNRANASFSGKTLKEDLDINSKIYSSLQTGKLKFLFAGST